MTTVSVYRFDVWLASCSPLLTCFTWTGWDYFCCFLLNREAQPDCHHRRCRGCSRSRHRWNWILPLQEEERWETKTESVFFHHFDFKPWEDAFIAKLNIFLHNKIFYYSSKHFKAHSHSFITVWLYYSVEEKIRRCKERSLAF